MTGVLVPWGVTAHWPLLTAASVCTEDSPAGEVLGCRSSDRLGFIPLHIYVYLQTERATSTQMRASAWLFLLRPWTKTRPSSSF